MDKNEQISLEELNLFLAQSEHVDKEQLAMAFQEVDPQRSGEINFAQFQQLITNLLN